MKTADYKKATKELNQLMWEIREFTPSGREYNRKIEEREKRLREGFIALGKAAASTIIIRNESDKITY